MVKNKKIIFNNEKVIWGWGEAKISIFNASYIPLKFYSREIRKVKNSHNLKILDVGCSSGALTYGLKRIFPNCDFWGCDVSKNAIRKANGSSYGINFFYGDAQKLPFQSNFFDIVLMNSVLDHLEKPDLAVEEVHRVLRKNGVFLSMTPIEKETLTLHGILSHADSFRNHRLNYCGHIHAFNSKELIELIKRGGLKIKDEKFALFFFSQVLDVLYYLFLALFNKGPESSLSRFSEENKNILTYLIRISKTSVKTLENIEALIFSGAKAGIVLELSARKGV